MNTLAQLATRQLTSHIAAWVEIPMRLSQNNPISYRNGAGLNLEDRLAAFAGEVRRYEADLLKPLGVSQQQVDQFLSKTDQYRLLFWQLPLPWVRSDRSRAYAVLDDIEALGLSLRRIERTLPRLSAVDDGSESFQYDQAPITIGREITYLRRLLASRTSFAEEIQSLMATNPADGVAAFYEEGLRRLRGFDPLMTSLEVYHQRRISSRPPVSETV